MVITDVLKNGTGTVCFLPITLSANVINCGGCEGAEDEWTLRKNRVD